MLFVLPHFIRCACQCCDAPRARFAPEPGSRERPASVFLDPADGAIRGDVVGEEIFATIRRLHRWLALPGDGKGWGRTVTTLCAIALLIVVATGLSLRWPGGDRDIRVGDDPALVVIEDQT